MEEIGGATMPHEELPSGLVPSGGTPDFTQSTIPQALQREHALAAGRWGVLQVLEGGLRFVDMDRGVERLLKAPDRVIIRPESPHRVVVGDVVRFRIDFFREASEEG